MLNNNIPFFYLVIKNLLALDIIQGLLLIKKEKPGCFIMLILEDTLKIGEMFVYMKLNGLKMVGLILMIIFLLSKKNGPEI